MPDLNIEARLLFALRCGAEHHTNLITAALGEIRRLKAALSSPSVADSPTPKELHLFDVYHSLGVEWGDDVFSAIDRLKSSGPAPKET